MNKLWSEQNANAISLISKKDSFEKGIDELIKLRRTLFHEINSFRTLIDNADFSSMPYINTKGYHNKTVAYSLYHSFRIEDIVANTLIKGEDEIFFIGNYKKRMNSPIITTGNELIKEEIGEFSKQLDIDELYNYCFEVMDSTDYLLKSLAFSDLKSKVTDENRDKLNTLNVVSTNENAIWLIDYWCKKNILGLIKMPFARHHIMHIEASKRIIEKINRYK